MNIEQKLKQEAASMDGVHVIGIERDDEVARKCISLLREIYDVKVSGFCFSEDREKAKQYSHPRVMEIADICPGHEFIIGMDPSTSPEEKIHILWHEYRHYLDFIGDGPCGASIEAEVSAETFAITKSLEFAKETGVCDPLECAIKNVKSWSWLPDEGVESYYLHASGEIMSSGVWTEAKELMGASPLLDH